MSWPEALYSAVVVAGAVALVKITGSLWALLLLLALLAVM